MSRMYWPVRSVLPLICSTSSRSELSGNRRRFERPASGSHLRISCRLFVIMERPVPAPSSAGDLARGGEIAEAVETVAGFDQPEHRELLDDLGRQLGERCELGRGVGLRLFLGRAASDPGEELPLARDRDAVGLRLREAVGRAGRHRAAASRAGPRSGCRSAW